MLGSKGQMDIKGEIAPANSVSKQLDQQDSFISGVEINDGTDT